MATPKVSLRLVIDPKTSKVLFAETEKDFVDFLCTLLCLPLGAVIYLLKDAPSLASIQVLYKSIQNLSAVHMQPDCANKDQLLKPIARSHILNPALSFTKQKMYQCSSCSSKYDISYKVVISCKNLGCSEYGHVSYQATEKNRNGYVRGDIKYMVMDDLSVLPIISIESCFEVLRKMNINDVAVLHTKIVEVDTIEGLELLKASLESKEVLTNVFLVN